MIKKIQEKQPVNAKLVTPKEEFKLQLEQRIAKGNELLLINVATQRVFDAYGYHGEHFKYDNTAKDTFFDQYKKWTHYNIELLNNSFDATNNKYTNEYERSGISLLITSNTDIVKEQKDEIKSKITTLESFIERLDLIPSLMAQSNIVESKTEKHKIKTDEVFIVHGHDDLAQTQTARFIEKLGLRPIILHEQVNSGKTIIEKIEKYSNVGFGVVLYTPCDKGCKNGEEARLSNRARQNVVFEHGYLIGKIGRKNVCALVKGDIETPNDISGVVYIKMDDNNAWQLSIAKELKNCGYTIDLNKLI